MLILPLYKGEKVKQGVWYVGCDSLLDTNQKHIGLIAVQANLGLANSIKKIILPAGTSPGVPGWSVVKHQEREKSGSVYLSSILLAATLCCNFIGGKIHV